MARRYAIMLDLHDRRIVIVGGGTVAARKAAGLIEAGANDVRVVAPQLMATMPAPVRWIPAAFEPAHLDDAQLVFAATDQPAINQAVMEAAAARGILVSRADGGGDFSVPARLSAGPIEVAVSAGSAALSAAVRDRIGRDLDQRLVKMAEAMAELRPLIRDRSGLDPATRRAMFHALAGEEALDVLDRDGPAALHAWIAGRFPQWAGT